MANTFLRDKDKGRTGELYAMKHMNELITPGVISVQDTAAEKTTGKDCVVALADKYINVEIKTVWNYLWRTNNGEEPSGTLEFELWSDTDRKNPGWFPKMVSPDLSKKAIRPDVLIFVLVAYQNVFASIAFENVDTLIDALIFLAKEDGIDLTNLPCGDEAQELNSPYIIDNVWHVPFSLLKEYATITIIGDKPRERPNIVSGADGSRTCARYCQSTRYDALKVKAVQTILADDEFARSFTGDELDDVIAIVDNELQLLERSELYSSESCLAALNKRIGVFDSLQAVLLNMLAHENASREKDTKNYFPISYSFIQDWEESRGHPKAIKTWFSHLKILLTLGMLEYFRPPRNTKNAIDIMVNKNNEKPDCVGYYRPVLLTEDLCIDAECKAQDLLHSAIRLSEISKKDLIREEFDFEKVDNDFGNDGRKVSRANDYVYEKYLQTMFDLVYEKGYVLPEEVARKVETKIKAEKRLWKIEGDVKKLDEKGKKEWKRQKPYWDEYNRLTKATKHVSGKLYFEYGPLTKTDVIWLEKRKGISVGQWVIKPKATPSWALNMIFDYKIRKSEKKKPKGKRKKGGK